MQLDAPDMPTIKIPTSGKEQKQNPLVPVGIWSDNCEGVDEGDQVAEWISKFLGNKGNFRLVRMKNDHDRLVNARVRNMKSLPDVI